MQQHTVGIPTVYRSTRFRSRLEARWACMFDKLGWRWEYEPFDLDGWIPDFLIPGWRSLLVEVKPCVEWDAETAICDIDAAFFKAKLDRQYEAILLGCILPETDWGSYFGFDVMSGPTIGWIRDYDQILGRQNADDRDEDYYPETIEPGGPWSHCWCQACITLIDGNVWPKPIANKLDICSQHGDWTGRISGVKTQHGYVNSEIERMWKEAGNEVQWKGRR